MGTQKQSEAARHYWNKLSKKKRAERLAKMHDGRKAAWAKIPPKQRSAHARALAQKRHGTVESDN